MVSPTELRLQADQTTYDPMPIKRLDGGKLDMSQVTARFKELKANLPDQVAITVQPEDKVRYDDLVRIIDECIGAGLPQVSLAATQS
jgi:biopolymer transport protein TolR